MSMPPKHGSLTALDLLSGNKASDSQVRRWADEATGVYVIPLCRSMSTFVQCERRCGGWWAAAAAARQRQSNAAVDALYPTWLLRRALCVTPPARGAHTRRSSSAVSVAFAAAPVMPNVRFVPRARGCGCGGPLPPPPPPHRSASPRRSEAMPQGFRGGHSASSLAWDAHTLQSMSGESVALLQPRLRGRGGPVFLVPLLLPTRAQSRTGPCAGRASEKRLAASTGYCAVQGAPPDFVGSNPTG